ncbi:peroxiredoxin [Kibdelosporangium phytohabitans]|uniref:thioredoxin-dependent peroxiredoxin n=1 Tax=Kibdelosporangium phytohabitans TaxID=860235 RepID=A0A0N9HXL8_9PSEU|nr:peroxiredoxin [Kibdelosporangium phytohabitans]ALG12097.1 peroxiredoxin [Kibdelosporangium phytohabitans]MBE1463591.1 peroxiredoxin Q/BCP [Kibdelosporangium phytohabitans]
MKTGDIAADFELSDETGSPRTLSGLLADGPVVLFFYPAAMTGGCTAESCHFRDLNAEFAAVGAQPVGISPDPVRRQQEFAAVNLFDFPLLSDPDGAVASQFGARRRFGPLLTRRRTYVIDTDRRILDVIKSELRMSVHADTALAVLRAHVAK